MYGKLLTTAPDEFVPREQWPEYGLAADVPAFLGPRVVGSRPVGMYRRFWPIVVEEYVSDEEPVLADSDPDHIAHNRILAWQRLFRTDIPKGWRAFSKQPRRLEGFAELHPSVREYWREWDESARRYRRKWHAEFAEQRYVLENISYAEFKEAYVRSSVFKVVKHLLLEIIERKLASPSRNFLELWGVRDISTNRVVAGMATITSPECRGSHYISGFITDEGASRPVMVALMDNWFALSQERGIRFLHFGGFWMPGNPDNWKGFSQFKAKFGLSYVQCPPALFRFARGKFL